MVRGRIRKILTAGVLPQVLHNAQVVGSTETELENTTVLMGQMLGVKKRNSTHAALLSMPGWSHPIYKVTIPLVKNWLQLIWKHEVQYSDLNRIMDYYHSLGGLNNWRRGKLPWAALTLTLKRVGWGILTPILWVDHQGRQREVHLEAPRDVLGSVREACTQWILQKIVKHAGFEEKNFGGTR